MIRNKKIIATPPGATIKEQLINRKMSQKEFALRMDMSEKHISKLINGEVQLTIDMALRLEVVLGVPVQFWLNLESIYREKIAKINAESEMETDIAIAKLFPYNEMTKNGWVAKTNKDIDRVLNLRKYFEVVKLGLIKDTLVLKIACRKLGNNESTDYSLLAWAQKAKYEARQIETKPVNIEKIPEIIMDIRKMTKEEPSVFCDKLISLLADYGIAVIFLPHIKGSFLHGATFYDGNKIVMGLTVRGKDADRFWFSLYHELAHIVYGHISEKCVISDEEEKIADEYAQDVLIPKDRFEQFVVEEDFSREAIKKFANDQGIDEGIVVGRLQKERYIKYDRYNDLKSKYIIE